MPVYKKKNKWYARLNYVDSFGKYTQVQSKYFDTKREAQEELAKLQVNHKQVKSKLTFDDIFNEYIKDQTDKVKPSTHSHYKPLYEHIRIHIGNVPVQELTIPRYKTFKEELTNDGLSTSRKSRIHKFVCTLTKYAYQNYGILNDVPNRVGGFKDTTKIKEDIEVYTEEEFKQFIKQFDNDIVYHSLFMVLFYQGLRIGEALALNWNDIDFENAKLRINKTYTSKINKEYKATNYSITSPKTQSSNRTIPIYKDVLNALKTLYNYYEKFDNFNNKWFVFGGFKTLSETTLANKKNDACKKAKLKQITIHQFRHSCISFLANNGVSPMAIKDFVGHSKLSTTMDIYTHVYKSKIDNIFSFKS